MNTASRWAHRLLSIIAFAIGCFSFFQSGQHTNSLAPTTNRNDEEARQFSRHEIQYQTNNNTAHIVHIQHVNVAEDGRNALTPTSPSRAFPLWKDSGHPPPCIIDPPPDDEPNWNPLNDVIQRQPTTAGILIVKIDKAGSSTLSGVAARIAHAMVRTNPNHTSAAMMANLTASPRVCRVRLSHVWSKRTQRVSDRDKARSFLFTMVRDPSKRAMSEFSHFRVARAGVKATDDNAIKHLKGVRNFQLGLVVDKDRTKTLKNMTGQAQLDGVVQGVIDEFNFIGMLERLEESLVLLQLILGLETSDVLYLAAKQHGSYDPFQGKCRLIPPAITSPKIDEYLSSDEWIDNNKGDHALFRAVNRSMDLTINVIGKSKFQAALSKFRFKQALANEKCEATLPCLGEGIVRPGNERNCYWADAGCNYPCLDRLFHNGTSTQTTTVGKAKQTLIDRTRILPSRSFPLWKESGQPVPCIIDSPPADDPNWHPLDESTQKEPTSAGLLMIKIDKAGSSTLAGVAARMAHALARMNITKSLLGNLTASQRVCRVRISHAWSLKTKKSTKQLSNRDKARSFLFTMVRDPSKRALSEFFHFRVGMAGMNASDENAINHLKGVRNFQLGLVVDRNQTEALGQTKTRDDLNAVIHDVLDDYNFIGMLERLDESLVLLQLILGLDTRDVLYLSAKQHGSYMLVESRANDYEGECKLIPQGFSSPKINEYLSSDEWLENNKGDQLLYEAVNRSMDRTIDAIGRSKFQYALSKFRLKQALANEECEATLPCKADGTVRPENERNCLWLDAGCNHQCLDRLFPRAARRPVPTRSKRIPRKRTKQRKPTKQK